MLYIVLFFVVWGILYVLAAYWSAKRREQHLSTLTDEQKEEFLEHERLEAIAEQQRKEKEREMEHFVKRLSDELASKRPSEHVCKSLRDCVRCG